MDPTPGTEPVGTREEIRLEDRLQHQLQGRLDHPVPDRADPQASAPGRARFRDQPLPRRQRAETAVLQRGPQRAEELPDTPRLDGYRRPAVHPGSPRALVAPHPNPADQKEGGISDEVEQVTEPAMRIIAGPAVQLGLDLQYPALRQVIGVLKIRITGIHRRDSWHSSILPASLAGLLRHARASRAPGLLRGLRPARGHQPASGLPAAGL